MIALGLEEFERDAGAFDRAVASTPAIDHSCSASDWILPASAALMPPREPFLRRGEHGWVALMRQERANGQDGVWHSLEPLEAAWGLACPFAGDDAVGLAREFADEYFASAPRDVLLLAGVPPASPLLAALVEELADRCRLSTTLVPPARRYRASLRGGLDGFLSRRSSNFRANLRQARRRVAEAGIHFTVADAVDPAQAEALYARILTVEARSWKGQSGVGIAAGGLEDFYRLMLPRLVARRALRVLFARHDEHEVGFIFGALFPAPGGAVYRGLQFSYDDDYRACSLGNVAQYEQIARLCDEGVAVYDLGAEVDYKRRWGEEILETITLAAVPRR